MKPRTLLAAVIALALTAPAVAEDRTVPSDTYPTVQSAVDAAQTGDTIILKGGPFTENVSRLDLPADVTIKGKGRPVIDAGANGHGLELGGGAGLVITGIGVSNANGHAIRVTDCGGLVISRCAISGATQNGIFATDCSGLLIERNVVEDAQGTGIYTSFFVSSGEAEIARNRLERCGQWGIRIEGADGATADRNRIADGTGGIAAASFISIVTFDVHITRNLMRDLDGVGVLLDADESSAERNGLLRVEDTGIHVLGNSCVVDRNKLIENGEGSGILNQGVGNTFTRNKLLKCHPDGGAITEEGSDSTYERNNVILSDGHGFEIAPFSVGGAFRRNRVTRPGLDGFRVDQGANTFERNVVVKGGDDGFQVESDGNRFESNKVVKCESRGFQVESSGNTFIANKATRCDTGFDVRDDGNQFTANKAKGNSEFDLHDRTGDTLNTYDDDNKFKTEEFDDPPVM